MIPLTEASFLVTISGLDYYFDTFSGLDDKAQVVDYSDGLSQRIFKLVTLRQIAEFTLTKSFYPEKDKPLIDFYKNYCQGTDGEKTISIQAIQYCPTPEPIGGALILYGVKPSGLKGFEADKKSSNVAMLTFSFIADEFTYA